MFENLNFSIIENQFGLINSDNLVIKFDFILSSIIEKLIITKLECSQLSKLLRFKMIIL